MDTEIMLASEIYHVTQDDAQTLEDSVMQAPVDQPTAASAREIETAAAVVLGDGILNDQCFDPIQVSERHPKAN